MAMRSEKKYIYHERIIEKDGSKIQVKPEYQYLKKVLHEMDYGAKRRQLLHEMMKGGIEFQVNGHHCVQTKNDPDLKKLLKDGKIEMFNNNQPQWGRVSCTYKRTFVRVKNG